MDVVAAFVADAQPPVLVQPGDGSFDDPPLLAEPGAVLRLRRGYPRLDATAAELAPSLAGVVGAVAVEPFRSPAGTAAAAAHGRNRVHERDHLGDVVAVAARQSDREWAATTAGDQVMLGAAPGAVDGARAGLGAPPNARTCELSIAARDQSISSA